MRHIIYTCPVCCASMLETDAIEQERLSEIERLQEAVGFLVAALKKVKTRPGVESAFIAAVNLEHAHKVYGVNIETANTPHEGPGAASSRTVPLDAVVGPRGSKEE